MKQAKELYNLLKGLGNNGVGVVSVAEVKTVDKDKCTCVVIIDELEVVDVRLKATTDNGKGFKLFPKLKSFVLVEQIADGQFVVQMMSEIESVVWDVDKEMTIDSEKWQYKHNGLQLTWDGTDGKIEVKNNGVSLKDVFDDLKTLLQNFKVLTAQGPSSGLVPTTILDLVTWQNKYMQLIK